MAAYLRATVNSLTSAVGLALQPVVTVPLLVALLYAPKELSARILNTLQIHSPSAATRLIRLLGAVAGFGVLRRANRWLSDGVVNNWTADEWKWDREVVVVTGGSSGIGELAVKGLAEKGARVIVMDIQPLQYEAPANVSYYHCDVRSTESVSKVAAEIRSTHGSPSVLINNAGIGTLGLIVDTPDEDIRKTFDINIIAHFTLVREFLPAMIKNNHGHVVTVASMASFAGAQGMVPYCCTKAAVLAFHEGLSQELRGRYNAPRVRLSIIHPIWTKTPLISKCEDKLRKSGAVILSAESVASAIVKQVLRGRSGQVILPPEMAIVASGLRGFPTWLQERMRNGTKDAVI